MRTGPSGVMLCDQPHLEMQLTLHCFLEKSGTYFSGVEWRVHLPQRSANSSPRRKCLMEFSGCRNEARQLDRHGWAPDAVE